MPFRTAEGSQLLQIVDGSIGVQEALPSPLSLFPLAQGLLLSKMLLTLQQSLFTSTKATLLAGTLDQVQLGLVSSQLLIATLSGVCSSNGCLATFLRKIFELLFNNKFVQVL